MSTLSRDASLRRAGLYEDTNIYELSSPRFSNRYFILSGAGTRRLMASPEVVGFESYSSMLPETVAALRHLFKNRPGGEIVDILTILRGGLNYPLEEACHRTGLQVRNINFVSCERIIQDNIITGLDIKYEKLSITSGTTLLIGDIIATGDTLSLCLDQVVDRFRRRGGSIRRIVFFTIGGTRAIDLMERFTERIGAYFPEFEGFDCFFFEGVFSVYRDKGVAGINVPDIDFGWQGGVVSPEFRRYVMDHPWAVFEKCIIYDGGARRYEIPLHFEEVYHYWNALLDCAGSVDSLAFAREKIGYSGPLPYEEWKLETGFSGLDESEALRKLWEDEQQFLKDAPFLHLDEIAARRIEEISKISLRYE